MKEKCFSAWKSTPLLFKLSLFFLKWETWFCRRSQFLVLAGRERYWHSFGKQCHVTACGALRCAPAEKKEEEEESLDAWVELGARFSFENRRSSRIKFQWRIRGVSGSGMELSRSRLCGVLLTLLASKFSVNEPLSYFNSLLRWQRGRRWSVSYKNGSVSHWL